MGKITGFLEIDRHDRKYAPVAERVQNFREFVIPLSEKDDWESVKTFAAGLAHEMVETVPAAYVATMTKAKRNGKIFIDFFRNDYTATAIADYAVRARPGAPVALPLSWDELDDLESGSQFTMKDVLARIRRKKPPAVPALGGTA